MNFTLTYDGDLFPKKQANKKDIKHAYITHKQEIRRVFHCQLKEFWNSSPIDLTKKESKSMLKKIGDYHFFPIVPTDHNEIAELEIIMLRPGQGPGSIIAEGGDIDNRLKTLFDSLTIPKKSEIPPDDKPEKSEDPFYCLLEDDVLIANLSVATDRLLKPDKPKSYVKLIIRVQIKHVPTIGASRMSILIRA